MAYFLYAASACVAVLALFFLFLTEKKTQHYFMFVSFFCLSYTLFYFGSSLTGLLVHVPILFHSDVSATFIAAPSIYLIFLSLLKEGRRPVRFYTPYFVIPVLVTVGIAIANVFLSSFEVYRVGYPDVFSVPLLLLLNFLGDFGFTFYFSLTLFRARELLKKKEITHRHEFDVMIRFVSALFLDSLFMLSAYVLRSERIFSVASVFYAIIVTVFCLVSVRIPNYILGRLHKPPVPNSLLKPEEMIFVRERLSVLMGREYRYKDPDLTLKQLAQEVRVTPHQLSWYINTELGMGFSEYVNGFRLEAVRKALLADKERPILEIAFDNGFGSKTTFNALFVSVYGTSPRELRKKNGG